MEREPDLNSGLDFGRLLKFSILMVMVAFAITFFYPAPWTLWGALGLSAIPLAVMIAAGLFWLMVIQVSHRWLRLGQFYDLSIQLNRMLSGITWPQIVILSTLAGIGEELLFRGLVQSWLTTAIGPYTAIVLSSLIFGLLHAMTRYYFVFTFGLSLVLGGLFYITQSMMLLILIHAFYDMIALAVLAKYPTLIGLTGQCDQPDKREM